MDATQKNSNASPVKGSILAESKMLPMNVTLMNLTPDKLKTIRPIKTLDIFDGRGGSFHEDGLFSTTTFGRVGDPIRDRRFGYIPLHINILHPTIFTTVIRLNSLYEGILSGREYAVFNEDEKDFVSADALTGNTGYAFFVKHFEKIVFKRTGSAIRDIRVNKVVKYQKSAFIKNMLVMPAGLREADFESDGRVSMDEINELYQGLLMQSRNIPEDIDKGTLDGTEVFDRTRYSMTLKIVEIYHYVEKLLSGKRGFIQGRWASRRVFNSTRNVLSSLDTGVSDLTKPNRPHFRDIVIGLNQATKNVLPKAVFYLKNSIIADIFDTGNNTVELVDPGTLTRKFVEISSLEMDKWTTIEGLERVINDLGVLEKRDKPVLVDDHYLALIYVDDKSTYRIIRSIDDLPDSFDKKWVRPLTLIELIYLSGVDHWNTFPCFVTRYPVENMYSSVPCYQYVKTTEKGELRYQRNAEWEIEPTVGRALEFPIITSERKTVYHDSTSVPVTILAALGADFDGDTVSTIAAYSDEAFAEAEKYFKSRRSLLRAGGGVAFDLSVDTLKLTLKNITGEPNAGKAANAS